MSQSHEKISKAAATTDKVQSLVSEALDSLQSGFNGRVVNGFGVYADRSSRYSDLNTALVAIRAAMDLMRGPIGRQTLTLKQRMHDFALRSVG